MNRGRLLTSILFCCAVLLVGVTIVFTGSAVKAQGGNLVANPSFETGGASIGQDYNQNGWTFFVIEEPVKGVVLTSGAKDGSACFEIQTDDGRGFLHSDPFAVTAGAKLNVSAWVKGAGEGAIEILWWKKYDDDTVVESAHHRDVVKEFKASSSWQQVGATADIPEDAKFAYIRLVAKGKNVCFDGVSAN